MKFIKVDCVLNNSNVVRCNKLTNDIIFMKYDVTSEDIVEINNDEFVVLVNKGEVYDTKEEYGFYLIKDDELRPKIKEEWEDLHIRKTEEDSLCVIFLNKKIIKDNKYLLQIPIKNLEFNESRSKEKYVYLEGHYNFKIENHKKFFSKIIGIRKYFTKQELIEKIRKYVLKSIEKGINDILQEYNLDIKELPENFKKLELKLKENEYDTKLLEYGVKLTYFDISSLEVTDKKIKFF